MSFMEDENVLHDDNQVYSNDSTTLLHGVILHNNLSLIGYLLSCGCNVNAKNPFGETALLVALKTDNFEAVKILVEVDADVCVIDAFTGMNFLACLIKKWNRFETVQIMDYIIPSVIENLKRRNFDTETLVKLLIEAQFPFKYVMLMKNNEVNKGFLESNDTYSYHTEMPFAMEQADLKHVELMLRHGNKTARMSFYDFILLRFLDNRSDSWKAFLRYVMDWKLVDCDILSRLYFMFKFGKEDNMQELFNCGIVRLVKEKFAIDSWLSIFINEKVDAVEFLEKQDFDDIALGYGKSYNLSKHYKNKNHECLYRIYNQARLGQAIDINMSNKHGETPLFLCVKHNSVKIARILLSYDANVQAIYDRGWSLIRYAQHIQSPVLEILLAQLAISDVQGLEIDQLIQYHIDSDEDSKIMYDNYCKQLRLLQDCRITQTCTMFDILANKIESFYYNVPNLRDTLLDECKDHHELHEFYYSVMSTKIKLARHLYDFHCCMADIITKNTDTPVGFDHLVVRHIATYLSQADVMKFTSK